METADIDEAVEAIKNGSFVIVVDDASPQNTGDLITAAVHADAAAINFMMTRGRGLLCVAMEGSRLDELDLPQMVPGKPTEGGWVGKHGRPNFTVSVDAATTVTGDTAEERAQTIQKLIDPDSGPEDFIRPGHVFPIRVREGGTLVRTGHTEAAHDLAVMAGLPPAGVLSQILTEDGELANMDELAEFSEQEQIKIITIADIIRARRRTEKHVHPTESAHLPTVFGDFEAIIYSSEIEPVDYLVVTKGEPAACEAPLVRVHSGCVTGDILGSLKCDCGWQLHAALRKIEEEGCGVVLYIPSHEGRGIGLRNKIMAYHLQDEGYDTVEANEALGFPADMRDYGMGAQVLADLGITRMRLMTNNPAKYTAMEGYGLEVIERVPLEAPATQFSEQYLRTKKEKMGHIIHDPSACEDEETEK